MSAAEVLKAAFAVGVSAHIDSDDLVLAASAPPSPAVLDLATRNKASIVALLRVNGDGWSAEDWRVYFDERAGIAEFDHGLARAQAEAVAFVSCVGEPRRRWTGSAADAVATLTPAGILASGEFPDDFGKNGDA